MGKPIILTTEEVNLLSVIFNFIGEEFGKFMTNAAEHGEEFDWDETDEKIGILEGKINN